MDNFISGINFMCGLFIILVVEFGSFTSVLFNINYDSKNTNSFVKHSITTTIVVLLISIVLNL